MFFSSFMHCVIFMARIPFRLRSTKNSSVISDRKVIGHIGLTVPLKRRWCALHMVPRYTPTFISLVSVSHTKDIDFFDRVTRCSAVSCNNLHIMLKHQDLSEHVHHSDVGDQSGSIARTAHSTLFYPLACSRNGLFFRKGNVTRACQSICSKIGIRWRALCEASCGALKTLRSSLFLCQDGIKMLPELAERAFLLLGRFGCDYHACYILCAVVATMLVTSCANFTVEVGCQSE